MLRWLMTVVVSDEEEGHVMHQEDTGKAIASEPPTTRRSASMTSNRMIRPLASGVDAGGLEASGARQILNLAYPLDGLSGERRLGTPLTEGSDLRAGMR